jgi:lipoprotein-anchoring transpeptidase ErfK/SrfK
MTHWTWDQSRGSMNRPDGTLLGGGYSGKGSGLNNPAKQFVRATGPIPQGRYRIERPRTSDRTGRFAMPLTPLAGTNTGGRSAFQIHGDNTKGNRSASSGCIILPIALRKAIWASGVRELLVVA